MERSLVEEGGAALYAALWIEQAKVCRIKISLIIIVEKILGCYSIDSFHRNSGESVMLEMKKWKTKQTLAIFILHTP